MKKLYFFILFSFFAAGGLFFCSYKEKAETYFGDADAIGSEEDAYERVNYEWDMLHDPATGKIPAHIRERELTFASGLPNDALPSALLKGTTVNWNPRGPWNVGGRTRALAIDAANNNILLAGTTSGGMWRSVDAGQHWLPTLSPDQYKSVSCLAQDTRQNHKNIWYYGTGEGIGASASGSGAYFFGNGIYKSLDSGKTWAVLPSTTSTSYTSFDTWGDIVWNVVTNPSIDTQDVVFAAAYAGIYRSADGGNTWTRIAGTPLNVSNTAYYTDVAVSPSGIVYIALSSDGQQKGIFRSVDGGINFTDITPTGFPAVYDRIKIGISPSDESQVYFLANTPGYGQANANYLGTVEWNSLWKYKYINGDGSGNGGIWYDRSQNLPSTGGPFDIFQSQGSYDLVVKVKPDDTNTVFIGGTNIYRSTNGFIDTLQTTYIGGYKQGATLPIVLSYNNHHPDQHELVFMPGNPSKMISSNDGGVFITDDNMANNVVWQSLNNGYLTSMFYTCAIDHASSDAVIVGGAQDNGSWFTNSTNFLMPWVSPRGGDGSYCAIANNKSAYYFSIQNGKVMKAKLNANGGIDSFARIDPLLGNNYLFINPFTLDPNNSNIMYLAGGKYLWRNDDLSGIPYAANWDSIATNWVKFPDSVPLTGAKITCIAVSTVPANRVYFGTSSRRVYRIDNAHSGTPAATDITSIVPATFFPTAYVSSIAVDPTNADHVMVTFSNYGVYSIYYSENGGTTWAKAGGNLEEFPSGSGNGPSVRWGRIMPVNGGTVYLVGTSTGLYATTSLNGTNTVWVQQGTNNIGKSIINMIDSRSTDGTVVIATHSHGIFSGTINSVNDITTSINNSPGNSSSIHLTNFPNPFKNQTTIQFNLLQKETGRLEIFDAMGNSVKTIKETSFESGENQININTENFAPGIYYGVLEIGNEKVTRKMMVL